MSAHEIYCPKTPFRPTHVRWIGCTDVKLQLVASLKPQEGATHSQTCGLFYSEDGSVVSYFMNEVKEIPQVERVHSYSQPMPLRVAPADGAKVWTVDPGMPDGVDRMFFSPAGIRSRNLLERGELWATEDEAVTAFMARNAARSI